MHEIQLLKLADIPAAMTLVEAASWNQTGSDWHRVIDYRPEGCFKALKEDRLVGTVTSTAYGDQLAWIGMMLVDQSMRRQGIGLALMEKVVKSLQDDSVQTIKLDATPAGRPLYEQLGFVAQFDFHRWRRNETSMASAQWKAGSLEALHQHRHLDLHAFGVDRWLWLKRLMPDCHCVVTEHGYGMLKRGRIADYLGPVVAASSSAAAHIVAELVGVTSSTLFWDIPQQNEFVQSLAHQLGFEPVRTLTRMALGCDSTNPERQLQWAICDPATG